MSSLSSMLGTAMNETSCKMFGFDVYNGTHCYNEPTSEWTDGPHNGIYQSFEELYYALDEAGKGRLMQALHHYHTKQAVESSGYSLYLYTLLFFLVVQVGLILWYIAKHGWKGDRVQLWPWRCFPGVVSEINELLARIGVLLLMAVVNSVLWPLTIPAMVFLLVFRVLGHVSKEGTD